ncbi:hypothetical protein BKA62DRAFT_236100 [Auriculariales sp. MPI-PUGE-AT-0066]|nr:hypothetical protein BKA62DRAFT_236100 [Auriculariales sp. MPI-PUGE-AT-0066]
MSVNDVHSYNESAGIVFLYEAQLVCRGIRRVPRLVLRPRRSILPFIHNVRFWPSTICCRCPCPCLLPDVVVELQRSVNELSLAAQALSTKKGTSKEARNSARKLAEHAAELVVAVVAACKERPGALHVLAVSHLTVFNDTVNESMTMIQTRLAMGRVDRFISGSSTAGLIQTWSLGIAELGAMLKIDQGVAQLVLDPARCLELSNAKPDIVRI